jgi:ribosomal protection tetracycline resistance protein
MLRSINFAILAHIDAGKTTITENMLYETNVIEELGTVDHGNTQTDSMALEKERGITIRSSPISFTYKNIKCNLIDTPGHADFISEVERSLSVLDGAILVISGVEGIQAQTRVLMSSLRKLKLPTIIFINKLDRVGANYTNVIHHVKSTMTNKVVSLYTALDQGTKHIRIKPIGYDDLESNLIEVLSLKNHDLLHDYIYHNHVPRDILTKEFNRQVMEGEVFPIVVGSAANQVGTKELLQSVLNFFPSNKLTSQGILQGIVFKIERDSGEKRVYFRLYSGSISTRETVKIVSKDEDNKPYYRNFKVKLLSKLSDGKLVKVDNIQCGDIGVIYGSDIKIGDFLGRESEKISIPEFTNPNLETSIIPENPQDISNLYKALKLICEEDPLIQISKDKVSGELNLLLYGEIQKEIIQSRLLSENNIRVKFTKTKIVYIEKPVKEGHSVERIGDEGNPFFATVGLKVEPNLSSHSIVYNVETEWGALPQAFYNAIEETVYQTLEYGLYGWGVRGIKVTLTEVGYKSPISTASDFRNLTPLVLMNALYKAGTLVHEPINKFKISVPSLYHNNIISKLINAGATIFDQQEIKTIYLIEGEIQASISEEMKQFIKNNTKGEGSYSSQPYTYKEIRDCNIPVKTSKKTSPLNRREYLLGIFKGLKRTN